MAKKVKPLHRYTVTIDITTNWDDIKLLKMAIRDGLETRLENGDPRNEVYVGFPMVQEKTDDVQVKDIPFTTNPETLKKLDELDQQLKRTMYGMIIGVTVDGQRHMLDEFNSFNDMMMYCIKFKGTAIYK